MKTEHIEYQHKETTLEAFTAYNDDGKEKPGVLICHAWAGRDEFVIEKAKAIAELGYVGIAIDMYGKDVLGTNVEENTALMSPLVNDRALLRDRITIGLEVVHNHEAVDINKTAAIGFCFGGLCVLDLARSGVDIAGVVSFHGLLNHPTTLKPKTINAKVLALHGHDDPMVPPEQVLAFQTEMTNAKADWQFHTYGNTVHAFTNPEANDTEMGTIYNQLASQRAWHEMKDFFREIFQ